MTYPPAVRRVLLLLALSLTVLFAGPSDARAECGSDATDSGPCPTTDRNDPVWALGCCQNGGTVAYCMDGRLCVQNCRTQLPTFPFCGRDPDPLIPRPLMTCVEEQPSLTSNDMCPGSATCSCSGRQCGDNGCGTSCGACGPNQTCNASGQCESSGGGGGCTASCGGRQCGSDGCGGSCGACGANQTCNASGQCESSGGGGGCTPSCGGRQCGDDGCGGTCGTCGDGQTCNGGTCEAGEPACGCQGKACGDDGCGQNCGFCGPGLTCEANQCVSGAADPAPGGADATLPPQECPAGQRWNSVAGVCELLGATTEGAGGEDDGCAGGASTTGFFAALAGLVFLRRRARIA
jgi:hypothetical protein